MERPFYERTALIFSALGNEVRLEIVQAVHDGEKTVGQIATAASILQSSTSQHLAVLVRAGVLQVRKQGTTHYYSLRGPRIPRVLELIEEFCQVHGTDAEIS